MNINMYEYMKDELWSRPPAPGDRCLYKCVSMTSDNVQVTQLCWRLQRTNSAALNISRAGVRCHRKYALGCSVVPGLAETARHGALYPLAGGAAGAGLVLLRPRLGGLQGPAAQPRHRALLLRRGHAVAHRPLSLPPCRPGVGQPGGGRGGDRGPGGLLTQLVVRCPAGAAPHGDVAGAGAGLPLLLV